MKDNPLKQLQQLAVENQKRQQECAKLQAEERKQEAAYCSALELIARSECSPYDSSAEEWRRRSVPSAKC